MSWLKDKLRNWILSKDVEEDCYANVSPKNRVRASGIASSRSFESRGMGFTIYQAVGGNVMEYTSYDEKTDRHETRLHIIPSEQELGQGIAHIITYEMLRK
jgi:hypothetical protein